MVVFVKKFVSLAFCQKGRIKKKSIVAIELLKLEELKKKKKKDCGKINATATTLDDKNCVSL